MKVFLSWSGDRSKQVAQKLKIWIKSVIQATEPWMSDVDIERGSTWFSEIFQNLESSNVGIVCLTAENKNAPWILFEAGALAKGAIENRVMTLLIGLSPTDITGPLSHFNHTTFSKDSMIKLINTINKHLGTNALDESTLNLAFETWWPQLEKEINEIAVQAPDISMVNETRPLDEIAGEILAIVRAIDKRTAMGLKPKSDIETEAEVLVRMFLSRNISNSPSEFLKELSSEQQIFIMKKFLTDTRKNSQNLVEKLTDSNSDPVEKDILDTEIHLNASS